MQRIKRLAVVVLIALIFWAGAPARAGAIDTTPIIISAAAAGAVLIIGLIAILVVADEDDEEIMPLLTRPGQPVESDAPVRFATDCATADGARPLMCW